MQREKPCCPAAAARLVKKLVLPGGFEVGIVNLENILKEVADLKLAGSEAIKKELLQRVKIYNYVAPSAESDYSKALLNEYEKLFGKRV
ncbi:MAG: hypothetical protein A2Z77_08295 [Chloroflexi bacterium RBG_13_51_36]|nr:MAG: hypothetical protein A2Z77_08295 [Chloroflexi bacterium RBG_13_51_36]